MADVPRDHGVLPNVERRLNEIVRGRETLSASMKRMRRDRRVWRGPLVAHRTRREVPTRARRCESMPEIFLAGGIDGSQLAREIPERSPTPGGLMIRRIVAAIVLVLAAFAPASAVD